MNNQEAKFILRASRPDGQDADDPQVQEALQQAQRDPLLAQWLERERAADAKIAALLDEIAPPPELRAQILAGARASRIVTPWWRQQPWLAAAAAAVLLLSVSTVTWRATRDPVPPAETWAQFATYDLADQHGDHDSHQSGIGEVETMLARAGNGLVAATGGASATGAALGVDRLRQRGCRTVSFAGREVFEICFKRDGTWFHLYVARRGEQDPVASTAAVIADVRDHRVATWSDAQNVYALVTGAGREVLERVL